MRFILRCRTKKHSIENIISDLKKLEKDFNKFIDGGKAQCGY